MKQTRLGAILICVPLLLYMGEEVARAGGPNAKPNVLLIAVDDLNDWVGCLGGHPLARTPNMDRLAARGVLFSNAHCQATLCNPSRASLLMGLRPSTTGIYGLAPGVREVAITRDRVSLPQLFGKHGWRTFCAGKIFHDGSIPWKDRHGEFEVWEERGNIKFPPTKLVETPAKMGAMDWGVWPETEEGTPDVPIADATITEIEKGEGPWFIGCGFRLPHVPCFAPQKWFDLFPNDERLLPPVRADDRADVPDFAWRLHWKLPEPRLSWLQKADQWKGLARAYLATTSLMDAQLGRVLDALEKSGQAERTIIVLWSDHGWHVGEKGITGKNSLWERSTHVPLIVVAPGVTPGKCAEAVELLDVFPTLAGLCGLAAPDGLEGVSLEPQLKDTNSPRVRPAITTHNQGNHAVRDRDWRYIRYADGSEELYDMKSDPNEWKNLAQVAEHAERIKKMREWLPAKDAPPAPGSAHRILEKKGEQWYWEGKPIVEAELEK